MPKDTTIAAIATPPGAGGIGIIKISGPEAFGIAQRIFKKKTEDNPPLRPTDRNRGLNQLKSHRLYFGNIVDPANGQILDEVLLAVMRSPRSYTREDVVEIQAHAGPVALRAILDIILHNGARLAEPGEFTRRAFLNGRIDLIQAEAIVDLINARSETALKAAANQIDGGLTTIVERIADAINDLRIHIEAAIDFPDDVDEFLADDRLIDNFKNQVLVPVEDLIRRYTQEHVFRDGINLAIVGRPNVGKSSLMNCLLERERAIVTDVPGTTRDLIEDRMQILGIPINVIDTAGLHETDDPIEILGINMARRGIQNAHLILLVVEADRPLNVEDLKIQAALRPKDMILVVNKIDRVQTASAQGELAAEWNSMPLAYVSARYHQGIDALKTAIAQRVSSGGALVGDHSLIPNLRHKNALEQCLKSARAVMAGLRGKQPLEIMAIDVKEALDAIDRMTGKKADYELMDQIFSRFCIGK